MSMSNQGKPSYRPKMNKELSRFPESQKGGPLPVHNLNEEEKHYLNSELEEGTERAKERRAKNEAAVQLVRDAYFNRRNQGTI